MARPGVPACWPMTPLVLLFLLPMCLCACPRSCSCPSPNEVHCTFRHLPSIPRHIPKDTERVNLGYNNIEGVGTADFANLRQLEMLMLHGNDISSVTSGSFYQLRSLQILKMSYNKLKNIIPGMFEGLTSLVRLHLDHNHIDFIEPFSFSGLTSLKLLQLESNHLKDLHPLTFTTISILGTFWSSSLRHLYLADNRLEYLLPGTLQHLSKLEVFSLHGNPWTCDCNLKWLLEWEKTHEGIVKCKKDRDSAGSEMCAVCFSPQPLNNSLVFQMSHEQLVCERPSLKSPLKMGESSSWDDQEPDPPYTKDLERPLGHLTFMLSDSHGNVAHVACDVTCPTESTSLEWDYVKKSEEIAVNVTLRTLLECEIDRDALQNLWRLVAYYYESPAILDRGAKHENTSKVTYQYSQATSEETPYFTDLKGHLMAEPAWLLQPKVTLQLNRRKTTTKKLVMNFSTFISKNISGRGEQEDMVSSWAMIQRGTPGRIHSVLEHSDVSLECNMLSSGHQTIEWLPPDLTILDHTSAQRAVSQEGSLVLKNTSLSDSGLYHCFVRTETHVDIVSFRLTVRERFLSPSDLNGKKITLDIGGSLTLPCSVTSPQPSEIKWFLPKNQILRSSERKGRVTVLHNNTLIITRVTHEDAGEYSCLAANLYGADMLSHQVVVTGENKVDPLDETEAPLFEQEEIEGSGFQEIKRPTSEQTPQRADGKYRGSGGFLRHGMKGKRIKESLRKPNKSVKQLDPNRWAEILAKANAKISTVQPPPVMTSVSTTESAIPILTTPFPNMPPTTVASAETTSAYTISNIKKSSETTLNISPYTEIETEIGNNVPQASNERDSLDHPRDNSNVLKFSLENRELTTVPPITPSHGQVSPVQRQEDRQKIEETIKANTNPIWTRRQRPPYKRRRPPQRRLHPQKTTQLPSTTAEIILSTNAPHTNAPEVSQYSEPHKKGSEHIEKTKGVTHLASTVWTDLSPEESTVNLEITPEPHLTHTMSTLLREGSSNEFSGDGKPHVSFHNSITTSQISTTATTTTASGPYKFHKISNGGHDREKSVETKDTAGHNSFRITTTSLPSLYNTKRKTHSKEEQKPSKARPDLTGTNTERTDGQKNRSKSPGLSSGLPVHPWINQQNTKRKTQTSVTQQPVTSSPFWPYTTRLQLRPTVQNSRQHQSAGREWSAGARAAVVTNRPEITAQTAKPTPFIPKSFPLTVPPHSSSPSRTRDLLLFSRLRNRYRQSQIDAYRLAQLGKLITPKPRIFKPTRKPVQEPDIPIIFRSVTPPSILVATNKPHPPINVLYGNRWHYSTFETERLSTVLPFPNLMGSGVKPRITSSNTVSVSALAEADVFLACKSSGTPKPALSWTKVSTGATIKADTKHGQRFEVLSNGTFVIKNVQLQDRGQYLCTAQNKFGSDRMVVTLAVQTLPPKIVGLKAKDLSVYVGRPISLDCIAEGKPKAQISWILPDRTFVREVGARDRAGLLLPNGTLSIRSANFSNKGDYKCIASNAAGADTVTYHIHVAAFPPTISEEASETISIHHGRSVYLHCTAKGEPVPLLRWNLPDGSHIKPTQFLGRHVFVFPNGTLFIKIVSSADSGRYECAATNTVGSAKRVLQLKIEKESTGLWHRPSQQHIVTAMYGSNVFLHCPEPTGTQRRMVWQLPSKALVEHHYSPQRHITAFPNGTLKILQLTEKDGGNYLCMFQRPNGEEIELFQIEVLMKPPKIENIGTKQKRVTNGENFQVDCVATGLPDPEVSWSLPDGTMINNALQSDDSGARSRRYIIFGNGTLLLQQMGKMDEGDYTCYAKNTLGEDEMKVSVQVVPNSPKISSKEQVTLRIPQGESAHMKCDATGEPPPTIIWLSPRNEILSSSIKHQILNDGSLVINKVSTSDQGKYSCVARNSAGDDIRNIKLQVEVRAPHINGKRGRTETKMLAVSYQTLLLDCKAEGMPEPRISWTTSHGMSLPTPYLGGRFQVHKNGSLELRGIRKTDEGQFLCVATNYMGEASLAVGLEVASLAEKPSFSVPNIEVLSLRPDGGDIILECHATGKPKPEVVWVLPNSTLLTPGLRLQRFIHDSEKGHLRILQPVTNDKGVYRCLAKNVAGQAEKRYALEPGRKPQIRGISGPMKITFGQTLNMPCTVDGWPQATITWTLPNGLVLDKPQVIGRVTYSSNGTLQLRETAKFDRGTYTCRASNTFGSSTFSYPVTVMVFPPRITNALPSITRVNKGSPVTLTCIADGIPKPDISWTLPGRTTLVPNNRFTAQGGIHMTMEGSLVIQDPGLMNSGIYKCNAKNALGMDFKATYLQVI